MDFAVGVRDGDGSENIIHWTSCIIVSDRLYPLGNLRHLIRHSLEPGKWGMYI